MRNIGLTVNDEFYDHLTKRAEKDKRSIASEIRFLLSYALEAIETQEKFEQAKREAQFRNLSVKQEKSA